jgi:hypothetical protein
MGSVSSFNSSIFITRTIANASFASVTAGLAASIVVKAAQGVVRLAFLWNDIAGWKDVVKTFMGFEGAIDKIPGAADQVSDLTRVLTLRFADDTLFFLERYQTPSPSISHELRSKQCRSWKKKQPQVSRNLVDSPVCLDAIWARSLAQWSGM